MPTSEELKQRGDVISAPGSEIKTVANATGYSAPIGPTPAPTMPIPESPKTAPTGAPETMPATPDQNLENIRKVFGQEWTPSPTFTPEMQKQGVYGAVRIAGTPSVYTIGQGGKELSAEDYQKQFGTSSQEGIVGEVTSEQAQRLGIVLPTKKAIEDTTPPAVVSSEDARTKYEDAKKQVEDATAGVDNTTINKAYDDIQANIDTTIADLEKRRAEETKLINQQFDILATQQAGEQKKEVGTTTSTLARIGGFLGQSASSQGALLNLSQSHRQEQIVLEAKRAAALQAANNAITNKQYELARDKVTEVKNLNTEIEARRNKFFDQTMSIVQETRQQQEEDRAQKKAIYDDAIANIDVNIPTYIGELEGKTREEVEDFMFTKAKELRVDPNLLIGKYYAALQAKKTEATKEISTLATKYPTAGIDPATDTFATASEKIRNTREYQLDIAKAEADIDNVYSEIAKRGKEKVAEDKPLNVLDIARYNELYPEAGVIAGDTEKIANDKIAKINTPEAKFRTMISGFQGAGETYDKVVSDINESKSITNKELALKIAKEVYGITDTADQNTKLELENEIARYKKDGNLSDSDIRDVLRNQGYSESDIKSSSLGGVGSMIESLTDLLFGK